LEPLPAELRGAVDCVRSDYRLTLSQLGTSPPVPATRVSLRRRRPCPHRRPLPAGNDGWRPRQPAFSTASGSRRPRHPPLPADSGCWQPTSSALPTDIRRWPPPSSALPTDIASRLPRSSTLPAG